MTESEGLTAGQTDPVSFGSEMKKDEFKVNSGVLVHVRRNKELRRKSPEIPPKWRKSQHLRKGEEWRKWERIRKAEMEKRKWMENFFRMEWETSEEKRGKLKMKIEEKRKEKTFPKNCNNSY
jgi:hypothetical protein